MTFSVTLKNQLTGMERTLEIKSSVNNPFAIEREAKMRMNLYSAWDCVRIERIS